MHLLQLYWAKEHEANHLCAMFSWFYGIISRSTHSIIQTERKRTCVVSCICFIFNKSSYSTSNQFHSHLVWSMFILIRMEDYTQLSTQCFSHGIVFLRKEINNQNECGFKPQTLNHTPLLFRPHTVPMACPDLLSHWLPPNIEGQGQNNLYLFNKTLKTIMPCPALFPSPSPLLPCSQRSC